MLGDCAATIIFADGEYPPMLEAMAMAPKLAAPKVFAVMQGPAQGCLV